MKIRHKILQDFQFISNDKKIFILKSGIILDNYLYKSKDGEILVDKDIVDSNQLFFQPIDWKAELISHLKSSKTPQPSQIAKKITPFIEEMILSSIQQPTNGAYDKDRENKISEKEDEIEVRLKRIEKKEEDLRGRSKDIMEKELDLEDRIQAFNEKERNYDRSVLESSKDIDKKYIELQKKIDKDLKDLSIREKDLESKHKNLKIGEESESIIRDLKSEINRLQGETIRLQGEIKAWVPRR
jgi:hypothetical protein